MPDAGLRLLTALFLRPGYAFASAVIRALHAPHASQALNTQSFYHAAAIGDKGKSTLTTHVLAKRTPEASHCLFLQTTTHLVCGIIIYVQQTTARLDASRVTGQLQDGFSGHGLLFFCPQVLLESPPHFYDGNLRSSPRAGGCERMGTECQDPRFSRSGCE